MVCMLERFVMSSHANGVIAAAQIRASENKRANLEKVLKFIDLARKEEARLILFPEFTSLYVGRMAVDKISEQAEEIDGPFIREVERKARDTDLYVAFGFIEKFKGKVYNSVCLVSPEGILNVYRKIHLFDAFGFKESNKFSYGDKIPDVIDIEGLGKVSTIICYDIRFPELARILALRGCEILLVPAAWVYGVLKEEHWQVLLKARAIENSMYVVGATQVGNVYTGRSMIVDPMGITLCDAGEKEGIIEAKVSMDRVIYARKTLGVFNNRRSDIYEINVYPRRSDEK